MYLYIKKNNETFLKLHNKKEARVLACRDENILYTRKNLTPCQQDVLATSL